MEIEHIDHPVQPTQQWGSITTENELWIDGQPYWIAVPNERLRAATGASELGYWYAIGEAWAQIATNFMPDNPVVLDIGCGCGKMARFFVLNPRLKYVGLDVFWPSIYWCKREFHAVHERFRFEHIDVKTEMCNPNGTVDSSAITLPIEDASIDVVICASLFTHLPEPAFKRYLAEVHRCLNGKGRALISLHIEPSNGRFSGEEARIDISERYFTELAAAAGLKIAETIGNVFDQKLYVLVKTG